MMSQLRPALVSMALFTFILGLAYPLGVTGLAQLLMPAQADGSLLRDREGRVIGSARVGQAFEQERYLHSRPSAAGEGYDASASSGSNLGPLNPAFAQQVRDRAARLRAESPAPIPGDALTASASGLDPDISPANAERQVARIAAARGLPESVVRDAIAEATTRPLFGFIGQPAVNVLKTNLALDAATAGAQPRAR